MPTRDENEFTYLTDALLSTETRPGLLWNGDILQESQISVLPLSSYLPQQFRVKGTNTHLYHKMSAAHLKTNFRQ